ncbi:MAG: J domain-containing protein [Spirochaetaceae bacterium]
MNLQDAYALFKLSDTSTEHDLAVAYRRLVKRYHPDYNADRLDWAHRRMTQINQAYALVCDFVKQGEAGLRGSRPQRERPQPGRAEPDTQTRPQEGADLDEAPYRERAPSRQELHHMHGAVEDILDGVYTYYQYGLQNVHRRSEGVPRLRYRKALRHMKAGIQALGEHATRYGTTLRRTDDVTTLSVFAKSFLQNMLIEKYYIPSSSTAELKAYRHYRTGSDHLDRAIQCTLFAEELKPGGTRNQAGSLYVSRHEFMTVLVKFTESTWVPEAMIKLHLVDAFTAGTETGCFRAA